MNLPDIAVVDVEGQTDDAEQDPEAGKDRHSSKQLLRQEAVFFYHHCPISRRPRAWVERADEERFVSLSCLSPIVQTYLTELMVFHCKSFHRNLFYHVTDSADAKCRKSLQCWQTHLGDGWVYFWSSYSTLKIGLFIPHSGVVCLQWTIDSTTQTN